MLSAGKRVARLYFNAFLGKLRGVASDVYNDFPKYPFHLTIFIQLLLRSVPLLRRGLQG